MNYTPASSPQVCALSKDPSYKLLYDLVDIFSHSTLQSYIAYHEKNSAYLKELGVDHDRSMETMRLLTLCSLASATHQVPYDAIREALLVSVLAYRSLFSLFSLRLMTMNSSFVMHLNLTLLNMSDLGHEHRILSL